MSAVAGLPPVKVQLQEVASVELSVKITGSVTQTVVVSAEKSAMGGGVMGTFMPALVQEQPLAVMVMVMPRVTLPEAPAV